MQEKALQEDVKLAPEVEEETVDKKAEEPAKEQVNEKEKFVAGEVPAVAAPALAAAGTKTASQLAYDGDSQISELASKLTALVDSKYEGDVKKAFSHYGDRHSHDPSLDRAELIELLTDAHIGNSMSRGEWATALLQKLDKTGSGQIHWREFQTIVKATKKSEPAKPAPAPAKV
jgi:hypothetical protein